jgi:hypothetical protein
VIPEHGKNPVFPGISGSVIIDRPSLNGKNPCFGKEGMIIRSYLTGEDAKGIFYYAGFSGSCMFR